jgi:hypothetical protein
VKLGEEWEVKVKVKHSLYRTNTVPEGSRVLRLQTSTQSAHEIDKVISPKLWPP